MSYYISAATGGYYEGEQVSALDIEVPQRPSLDSVWNGSEWVAAPPPVPASVTRGQGREALLNHGMLLQVEANIAAITDATERMRAQINYERETWERSNPFLQAMWASLGGTETELDAIFVEAATL